MTESIESVHNVSPLLNESFGNRFRGKIKKASDKFTERFCNHPKALCDDLSKSIFLLIQNDNALRREDLEEISYHLVKNSINKDKFIELFNEALHNCYQTFKEIHEDVAKILTVKPFLSENEKILNLTYDQFKFANLLIQKKLPGLYALSSCPLHDQRVGQLFIQLLLGIDAPNNFNPYGFCISMDQSKMAEQFKFESDDLYFDAIIDSLKYFNIFNNCHTLEGVINIFVNQFIDKVIDSKKVTIEFDDGSIFWGPEDEGFDSFLEKFTIKCVEFLQNHEENLEKECGNFIEYLKAAAPSEEKEEGNCSAIECLISEFCTDRSIIFMNKTKISEDMIKNKNYSLESCQNWIRFKFIEFAILTSSFDYQDKLASFFSEFKLSPRMNKLKIEESDYVNNPIEIKFSKQKLIIDPSLFCLEHKTSYKIMLNAKNLQTLGLGYDVGRSRKASLMEFHSKFKKYSNHFLYLFKIQTPVLEDVKCLFHWQIPPQLLKYMFSNLSPNVLKNRSKEKYLLFSNELQKLAQITSSTTITVSDETVTLVQPSLIGYYSKLWSSSKPEISIEQQKHVINELKILFENGFKTFETYNNEICCQSLDTRKSQFVSINLRNLLEKSIVGLRNLNFDEKLLDNLLIFISELFFEKLPEPEEFTFQYLSERSFFEYYTSGIRESSRPQEIDWKLIRYVSQFNQLYMKSKLLFDETFDSNEKMLINSAEEPLIKKINSMISLIFTFKETAIDKIDQEELCKLRNSFRVDFIPLLREILVDIGKNFDEHDLLKKLKLFVYEVCHIIFAKINFIEESIQLNQKFDKIGASQTNSPQLLKIKEIESRSLVSDIKKLHAYYRSAPYSVTTTFLSKWGNSAIGMTGLFDPIVSGNLPEHLGSYSVKNEDEQIVKFLAFGSPTSAREIAPEFIGFMKSYENKGLKHLFVINQDMRNVKVGGFEKERVEKILEIGKEFFPHVLNCIVLSKNSDFYHQTDMDFKTVQEYKRQLFENHFSLCPSVSGNCIPDYVIEKVPDFMFFAKDVIEEIHKRLFYGKESLSTEERQIFYDVFQDFIVIKLIYSLGINTFNISCKDAIDRAADSTARLWAHLGIVNNLEFAKNFKEMFQSILLARAMKVRKRPIIKERADRCIQSVDFYEGHKIRLQQLHKMYFNDCSMRAILDIDSLR